MNLSRRVLVPLACATAVVGLVAGCDASSSGEGSGNGAGQATSTGPQSSAAAPAPTATPGIPSPDAGQTAILIGALQAIEPDLALDSDRAVQGAVATCGQLQDGAAAADVVPDTFPDVTLTADQIAQVAAAITTSFCTGTADSSAPTASASAIPSATTN